MNAENITIIRQDRVTHWRGKRAFTKPRTLHQMEFYHDIQHEPAQPSDRRLIVTLEYWTTEAMNRAGLKPATDERHTITTRTARDYRHDPDRATGGQWTNLSDPREYEISPTDARALYEQLQALLTEQFHAPHDWRSAYRKPGYFPTQTIQLPQEHSPA